MAAHGVCPWWVGYFLASPLRRLLHDPVRLLSPYVRAGMIVFEPGPGMGFFTLELARLVGPAGRVIAVDIEPRMIAGLRRRARRAGLLDRIDARVGTLGALRPEGLDGGVDFIFAFAVVHEMPAPGPFFAEVAHASRRGATLLLAEPSGHVNEGEFAAQLAAAEATGFTLGERPAVHGCRAAVLHKTNADPGNERARQRLTGI